MDRDQSRLKKGLHLRLHGFDRTLAARVKTTAFVERDPSMPLDIRAGQRFCRLLKMANRSALGVEKSLDAAR